MTDGGCEFCCSPFYAGTRCSNCGRDTAPQSKVPGQVAIERKAYLAGYQACLQDHGRKPLSRTDLARIWEQTGVTGKDFWFDFARAIERAHGIDT